VVVESASGLGRMVDQFKMVHPEWRAEDVLRALLSRQPSHTYLAPADDDAQALLSQRS
jgi:hypothetical protein